MAFWCFHGFGWKKPVGTNVALYNTMSIRFSYSPAESTLTLVVRDDSTERIKRALKRASETAALEIQVIDASSSTTHWHEIAEMCMQQGPRFVYRRATNTTATNAA